MSGPSLPRIGLYPHDDGGNLDFERLQTLVNLALPWCLASPGAGEQGLAELEEVEINFVSDATIAVVHADFMDDPTPTDVITFHHGEIFVSCETARREGPGHGHDEEGEVLLYMIHGLLHLNGHTDAGDAERELMHGIQETILARVLSQGEPGV